jgi:hypothetical protein
LIQRRVCDVWMGEAETDRVVARARHVDPDRLEVEPTFRTGHSLDARSPTTGLPHHVPRWSRDTQSSAEFLANSLCGANQKK